MIDEHFTVTVDKEQFPTPLEISEMTVIKICPVINLKVENLDIPELNTLLGEIIDLIRKFQK